MAKTEKKPAKKASKKKVEEVKAEVAQPEVVKKTKRSVLKRAKLDAIKQAAKTGPAIAYLKNVPSSPRKMRLVVDLIRGERVSRALNILKYEPQQAAARLEKLLLSAISNWESKNSDVKLEEADLFVKEVFVDGGRQLKRLRPAPQGRAHRIRKRSNHVTLVVDRMPVEVKQERPAKGKATTEKETKE
jgi:large subunit ribosomal protein L22